MSCWVAVSIATDFLNLSPVELMQRIEAGTLATRYELGMLMVDVKPHSPAIEHHKRPTFPLTVPKHPAADRDADRVVMQIDDPGFMENDRFIDWRSARAKTAQARRAPLAA